MLGIGHDPHVRGRDPAPRGGCCVAVPPQSCVFCAVSVSGRPLATTPAAVRSSYVGSPDLGATRSATTIRRPGCETHVSAQQSTSKQKARVPRPHVGSRRPERPPFTSAQGSPQAQRLIHSITHRREFERLRCHGRFRRSGPLGVRAETSSDDDRVFVAYAINRSVGNAVKRNRVKRQLREIVRFADERSAIRPGHYLVVVAPEATTASYGELQRHLQRLMT